MIKISSRVLPFNSEGGGPEAVATVVSAPDAGVAEVEADGPAAVEGAAPLLEVVDCAVNDIKENVRFHNFRAIDVHDRS